MRASLPLLSALALSLCAAPAVSNPELPAGAFNTSSHGHQFFHHLLFGRVFVSTRENYRHLGHDGAVRASYFGADGLAPVCTYRASRNLWHGDDQWSGSVRSSKGSWGRALLHHTNNSTGASTHKPLFYDPATGRFHTEIVKEEAGRESPGAGWVQDSWPRFLRDACPNLALPADLPINEKQTARTIEAMALQDPDAPIRNFVAPGGPSVNRRTPGGTGVGMAGGRTFPKEAFAAWLNEHSGQVLENLANSIRWLPHPRFVLAPRGGADGGTSELWWIDGRGEVVDVTRLEPSADRSRVALVTANYPERPTYVVGYAWPMAGTGERHPAFQLTDWLSSLDRPVSIPWWEQGEAGFQFLAWGQIAATSTEGEALTGSWWWSAGQLHVRLDDGSGDPPARYPWRELAEHVGWEIPEGWR